MGDELIIVTACRPAALSRRATLQLEALTGTMHEVMGAEVVANAVQDEVALRIKTLTEDSGEESERCRERAQKGVSPFIRMR
jgi:hypothetical protein